MKKLMHGLPNFGNTCYINSIIQVLRLIPELRQMQRKPTSETDLIDLFSAIVNFDLDDRKAYMNTVFQFVKATHLGHGQHDMHEYLLKLLDFFHRESHNQCRLNIYNNDAQVPSILEIRSLVELARDTMLTAVPNVTDYTLPLTVSICDSPIFNLFTGQFRGATQCSICQTITDTFESFRIMELSMTNIIQRNITIDDVLHNFTRIDTIEDFHCDICRAKTLASRQMTIWRQPTILILNVKRIQNDGSKDVRNVFTPKVLDLAPYTNIDHQSIPYKLFAIAYHAGHVSHGHCYAVINNDDKWLLCDDHKVVPIDDLPQNNQYLFFYRH